MKKLNRLLALVLALATVFSLTVGAYAVEVEDTPTEDTAASDTITESEEDTADPVSPDTEDASAVEEETPAEEAPEEEVPAEEPSAAEEETPTEEPSSEADVAAASVEEDADVTETEEDWITLEPIISVNPLYADVIDESDIGVMTASDVDEITVDSKVYASASSAGTAIRNYMKSRTTSFSITFTDSSKPTSSHINDIVDDYALAHTGVPTEGDYLRWQYGGWSCSGTYSYSSSTYTVNLTFTFTYYTTASQESTVSSKVSSLRSSLGLSSKTQYEKVKAIYNWMCSNITYDYDHVDSGSAYPTQFTAYGAIVDRTCVCQGYAVLFYRLALEEGIDARVVTSTNHAWNIVELDHKYYNLDATWDAGSSSSSWSYFLKCPANFDSSHVRESPYSESAFKSKYPMGSSDYTGLSTPKLTKIENTAKGVKISWNSVSGASTYDVYRKPYGGSWSKIKNVKTTSYTNTGVTSGRSYSYKIVARSYSALSSYSSTLTIRYLSAPTVTKTTNRHAGIYLEWKVTSGASGYNIYRRTGSGSYSKIAVVKGSSNNSYTDTSVQAKGGSTYTYRVVAYSGSYKSIYRVSDTIIRLDTPAFTTLKQTSSGVQIKWTTVSGASGYNIYRKSSSGSYEKLGYVKGSTSYTDTGVKGKTGTYTYKIEAFRGDSKSAYNTKSITLK